MVKAGAVEEKTLITLDMSIPSTAGFNHTFTGSLNIDFKDGEGLEALVSGVEKTNTYTVPGTYIVEVSGDRENITKFIADNSKITDLDNFKTGVLGQFKVEVNNITTLNLVNSSVGSIVTVNNNPALNSMIFPVTGRAITLGLFYNCNFTTIDFTNLGVGIQLWIHNNINCHTIIFNPTNNGRIGSFIFRNCDFGYIDFLTPGFTFDANGSLIQLQDNNMVVAEVNHILVDFYTMVSGEGAGGDYTGRSIRIDGTNAAPDSSSGGFDGDQAVIDLTGKGITVTTS